jgi:exodeoxyribonuclease-3
MKIFSWNINGIRAIEKKDFNEIILKEKPDVFCIQETKAFLDQIPASIKKLPYHLIWHDGTRPGYAGTAIFSKDEADSSQTSFKKYPKFHEDGRVTEAVFGELTLLNIYFPNGGERATGQEMLTYKIEFYKNLLSYIQELKKKGRNKILIVGDFNIAHTEIDIARPKENENTIGFTKEERNAFSDFLKKGGLVDIFRHKNPQKKDEYTWWSYRAIGARERNVGWRIDYAVCTQELLPEVASIIHKKDIEGSDHCPVIVTLKK